MAIDSLFERGTRLDWLEFVTVMKHDLRLAKDTLYMCDHHANVESAALARVLVKHFYDEDSDMGLE